MTDKTKMAASAAAASSSTFVVAPHRARSGRFGARHASLRGDGGGGGHRAARFHTVRRAVSEPASSEGSSLPCHLIVPTEHFNTDYVGSERNYDKKIKESVKAVKAWAEDVENGVAYEVTVRSLPPSPSTFTSPLKTA